MAKPLVRPPNLLALNLDDQVAQRLDGVSRKLVGLAASQPLG